MKRALSNYFSITFISTDNNKRNKAYKNMCINKTLDYVLAICLGR